MLRRASAKVVQEVFQLHPVDILEGVSRYGMDGGH